MYEAEKVEARNIEKALALFKMSDVNEISLMMIVEMFDIYNNLKKKVLINFQINSCI